MTFTQRYLSKSTSSHLLQAIMALLKVLSLPPASLCNLLRRHTLGRKKLKQVESEINRLSQNFHPNLLRVLAVKLTGPHGSSNGPDSSRLVVLSEERPRLSLDEVLDDCDNIKENKAIVRTYTADYPAELDSRI